MPVNLRNRNVLKEVDHSPEELRLLLELAEELKRAKRARTEVRRMQHKNIALVFDRVSTRTRSASEVAAHDQGAQVTYLGPDGWDGGRESLASLAPPLGRVYDAIEFRGFAQESRNVTVRLKTARPGAWSTRSATKYPWRSNWNRSSGTASASAGST